MNDIIDFIKRRFKNDCDWLSGNCYYFALILKDRFPKGQIVYDPVLGHFLFLYQGVLYDWTGAVEKRFFVPWETFEEYDQLQYQRIIDGCIK